MIDPPSDEETGAHDLADAEWAISAMTIAELHKGVLLAAGDEERAVRLGRLSDAEASFEALPLDTAAARVFGRYMAEAKRRQRSLRVRDAIIAATAEAHGLAVLTRDTDFERFGAKLITLDALPDEDSRSE